MSRSCPECNSNLIFDEKRADIICEQCGLVIEQKIIDQDAEWRAFTLEESDKRIRVGPPSTLTIYDKGLSTSICSKNKDAFGNSLEPKMIAEMSRLRKWHSRTKVSKSIDRNLSYALNELERFSSQLSLSKDLKESAAHIYRKMVYKNLIRGRSIEAMLVASIYTVFRINGIPKTLDDLLEFSNIDRKKIIRCYRLILRVLDIHVKISNPEAFLPRFCAKLVLSGHTQKRAAELLRLAKSHNIIDGKNPSGLAGAALYIAAIQGGEKRTQKEISITAGVTESTLRNRYKEIIQNLKF